MNIGKSFKIFMALIFVITLLVPPVLASAQTTTPTIEALGHNKLAGSDWPLGLLVTMTVDDPTNGVGVDYTVVQMPFEESGNPGEGSLHVPIEWPFFLKPGYIIQATNGEITKTLVYTYLEVTEIDTNYEMVLGRSDPGAEIKVTVHKGMVYRIVTADGSGDWTADFSVPWADQPAVNIKTDTKGNATRYDPDGDSIVQFWGIPNFWVYLMEDMVQGIEWPLGEDVTLTIDDPSNGPGVDYTNTQTVEVAWWNPNQTSVIFLTDTIGIRPGQLMVMTDGMTTTTHIVTRLMVTEVDLNADTVAGTANPGSLVEVGWICDENGCAFRRVTADADGNWLADFTVPGEDDDEQDLFDIRPGMLVRVLQRDDYGNSEDIYWEVPFNQPPVIISVTAPITPVQFGQGITATLEFSDPDVGDTHTVTWDWGDGATTAESATASHTYTSAGVYTITATITDAAGESASATFQYIVIYDPNGGFVTGGGWINSPAGAYTADPTLTGKATFGFVSKYQKGASVPTGNTEFQFKVADLNFKSASYDWLVIAGTKAQYKGTGTINGAGEYKFMLTAIDGTPDKFRIKIWDKATGNVIYDNMLGAADTDNPVTALGGGSIVIHKDK